MDIPDSMNDIFQNREISGIMSEMASYKIPIKKQVEFDIRKLSVSNSLRDMNRS